MDWSADDATHAYKTINIVRVIKERERGETGAFSITVILRYWAPSPKSCWLPRLMIIQLKCLWPPPYPLGLFLQCHFSKTVQPFLLSKYMYTHIYAEHIAAVHQGVTKNNLYIYIKKGSIIHGCSLFPTVNDARVAAKNDTTYVVLARIFPYHSSPLSPVSKI